MAVYIRTTISPAKIIVKTKPQVMTPLIVVIGPCLPLRPFPSIPSMIIVVRTA